MTGWAAAAVAVGVIALAVLGWSLARLAKALKEVRRSLDELAEVTPAARRVNGEVDQWRAARGRRRDS